MLNVQKNPPLSWSEYTVRNYYHIQIPTLAGSRVMMGLGPGKDGAYGADRIGTAYMVW